MKRFLAGFLAAFLILAPMAQAAEYCPPPAPVTCTASLTGWGDELIIGQGLTPGQSYAIWAEAYDAAGAVIYNLGAGPQTAKADGTRVLALISPWPGASYWEVWVFQPGPNYSGAYDENAALASCEYDQ
jgi:hypothetical protein